MKKWLYCLIIPVLLLASGCRAAEKPRELGIALYLGGPFGYRDTQRFDSVSPRDRDIRELAKQRIGGVAWVGSAVPAGEAVDKPLALRYVSSRADGARLEARVGNLKVNAGLYDWELAPLIRYVDSGSFACMTLLSGPNKGDSMSVFEEAFELWEITPDDPELIREILIAENNAEEAELEALYDRLNENDLINLFIIKKMSNIFWAAYNPAFGNTLIGSSLLFVDAMFIGNNAEIKQGIIDQVNQFPVIPHYTDNPTTQSGSFTELEEAIDAHGLHTYIFSDQGIPITYEIRNGKMEFTGFPYYQFMKPDDEGEYDFVPELNTFVRENYETMKGICPIIYDSAERWCRWSALFRTLKEKNPTAWNNLVRSVQRRYPYVAGSPEQTVYPEHSYKTPRFWIP